MKDDFLIVYQTKENDCGLACIQMIADNYNLRNELVIKIKNRLIPTNGLSISKMKQIAEETGFVCMAVKVMVDEIKNIKDLPCILHWQSNHFVVLHHIEIKEATSYFYVADPAIGQIKFTEKEFCYNFYRHDGKGVALLLKPKF